MKWFAALLVFCQFAYAKVDVKNITLNKGRDFATLVVDFKGKVEGQPKLTLKDSIVQIEIPDGIVWPKIEKKATLGTSSFDTTLMGYQFDKEIARVRAILPYTIEGKEDAIEMNIEDKRIVLKFPIQNKRKIEVSKGNNMMRNC